MRDLDARTATEEGWARLRPAAGAIALAVALLVVTAGWWVLRAAVASDAAPVTPEPGFKSGLTVDVLSDDDTALRPGDVVVGVNGTPVDDWLGRSTPTRPRVADGERFTYRVDHDGQQRDVAVTLERGLDPDRLRENSGILVTVLAIFGLGLYCVYRRPEQSAARVLLMVGVGLVAYSGFTTFSYDSADVAGARLVFAVGLLGSTGTLILWTAAVAHLALTYPTPVTLLQRRPWLVPVSYAGALALTVGAQALLFASGRATLSSWNALTNLSDVILWALGVVTLVGLVRTVMRIRREPASGRQGAIVALGLAITIVGLGIANLVAGDTKFPAWLDLVIFLPFPTAVAIAIVRGEFLDIRAVVNRTFVYGSLTAILLAVYTLIVVGIGAVVGSTGLASSALAAGVVAVAFAPLRASLQRAVDRLLYGERGDPVRVLGSLGHRLADAVPADEVLPAVVETVATTLNLPYVALRTGSGPDAQLACERGEPPAEPHVVQLVHQGEAVGSLLVGPRRGERAISERDDRLLMDVAGQIAAAVSATRLLTDLAASRSRLAVEREEERARVRHDLHDRLGPHLVGLSLQLDYLQSRVDNTDDRAAIVRAHEEARRALDEVRRISRGLRPAELEELGLVEAIGAAAVRLTVGDDTNGWRATVDAAIQLGAIAPDVEAAAYQIAIEALSNAYRHSHGHGARVHLGIDRAGTTLTVEISDDGHGIDLDAPAGVGLRSMQERAHAVGGDLAITSAENGGTVVRANLPLDLRV